MIKIIFFDIGGVLYKIADFENDFAVRYFGLPQKEFAEHFERFSRACENGKISDDKYLQITTKRFGVGNKKLKKEWTILYARKNRLNIGVMKIAMHVRTAGYKIGIISNTKRMYDRLRKKIGDLSAFKINVLSYQVGASKPSRKIYIYACKRAGIKPSEAVFIDDRMKNVRGAERAGMHAIHYRNSAQLRKDLKMLGIRF